ncbi:MAG: hypothetical protein QOJ54_160 [Aliidongia sp.]|jgi:hypothetical protein|nr:hypothetical protein [Aliidongia sp.]
MPGQRSGSDADTSDEARRCPAAERVNHYRLRQLWAFRTEDNSASRIAMRH